MKRLCVILLFFGMIISVAFLGGCTKTNSANQNQTSDNSSSTTPTPPTPPQEDDETIVVDESLYPNNYDSNGGPPEVYFRSYFSKSNIYDKVRNVVVHFSGWPTECNLLNETTGKKYVGAIDNNSLTCLFTDVQFAEGINNLKVTGKDALGTKALTRLEIAYSPHIKVDEFKFSTDLVFIDEPEDVLITAIISDGLYYQDKLELQVYDNASKSYKPAKLFLNDEGKNGDVTVKDGIFSFKFNSKDFGYEEGKYRFRAMIEINGVKNYTQAFEFEMGPAGVTEALMEGSNSLKIIVNYIEAGSHLPPEEFEAYLLSRIPEMKKLPAVVNVTLKPGVGLFIQNKVGTAAYYITQRGKSENQNESEANDIGKKLEPLNEGAEEKINSSNLPIDIVGNKKILCLSPFKNEFGDFDESMGACQVLRSYYYNVNQTSNSSVTVESFKNLHKYGVIIIASHGREFLIDGTGELVLEIVTKQESTDQYKKYYQKELKNNLIGHAMIRNNEGELKTYFTIRAKFFEKYTEKLSNNIIILSACMSMNRNDFWKVFFDKGAGIVIGYTNNVSNEYAFKFSKKFMEEMTTGKRVKRSILQTYKQVGLFDNKTNSYVKRKGNDTLRLFLPVDAICEDDNMVHCSGFRFINNMYPKQNYDDPVQTLESYENPVEFVPMPTEGDYFLRIVTVLNLFRYDDQVSLTVFIPEKASTLSFDYMYLIDTLCENDLAGWNKDQLLRKASPPPCKPFAVDALASADLEDEEGVRYPIFSRAVGPAFFTVRSKFRYRWEAYYYTVLDMRRVVMRTTGLQNVQYSVSKFRNQLVTLRIQFGDKLFGKQHTAEFLSFPINSSYSSFPKLQNGMYLDNFSIK